MLSSKEFLQRLEQLPNTRDAREIERLIKAYGELVDAARTKGGCRLPAGPAKLRAHLERIAIKKPDAEGAARAAIDMFVAAERVHTAGSARETLDKQATDAIQTLRESGTKAQSTGDALRLVLTALQNVGAGPVDRLRNLIDMHNSDSRAGTHTQPKAPTTEWGTFSTVSRNWPRPNDTFA